MDESVAEHSEDLRSRTRALLRRLGSIPESPEESRAFLQRRIRLYLAIAGGLWLGTWVFDRLVCSAVHGDFWRHPHDTPANHLTYVAGHLGVGLVLLGARAALGRLAPSARALTGFEVAITLVQVLALGAMMFTAPADLRPDLSVLLGSSHVLVLRAAIVPSRPRDTALLGIANALFVVGFAQLVFSRSGGHAVPIAPVLAVIASTLWALITIVSTVAISTVIYGLRQTVRAAMDLGQYTLMEKLGEGGMGVVYKARHALLRRPTAVKVLPPERAGDDTLARFEREVQITAQIAHPNIVSVYDFGRSPDGAFYYAMEFLDGIDLQRLVDDDGPQTPPRVVAILSQVAEALAEAHDVGLIHRDIKPANILLCSHSRRPDMVKVVDFGLVKELGGPTNITVSDSRIVTGTPLYMSPEAITRPNEIDERSDLYALGAVGYFLLTGSPVFEGRTVVEVCGAHLHKEVVPPSKRSGRPIPPKLEALILRCLAKARDDRPASAVEVKRELAACGVRGWDAEDARAWWQTRGHTAVDSDAREVSGVQKTLAIAPRGASVNRG